MNSMRATYNELERWVSRVLPTVRRGKSDDIHADELAQLVGSTDQSLAFMWSAYVKTIEILGPKLAEYMPMLAIDLDASDQIDLRMPSWDDLEKQLSYQPPSIYLTHRETNALLSDFEIYRSPLRHPPALAPPHADVYFFYSCSRTEEARRHGWEYTRTITAEHYPVGWRS